jgi:hypothetical protein
VEQLVLPDADGLVNGRKQDWLQVQNLLAAVLRHHFAKPGVSWPDNVGERLHELINYADALLGDLDEIPGQATIPGPWVHPNGKPALSYLCAHVRRHVAAGGRGCGYCYSATAVWPERLGSEFGYYDMAKKATNWQHLQPFCQRIGNARWFDTVRLSYGRDGAVEARPDMI